MSESDRQSYARYARSLPGRIKQALAIWEKERHDPFWQTTDVNGTTFRYHVILANDVKCFDDPPESPPANQEA